MPRFAWIKKGKQHCLLEGVYPCVRDCGKEYLAQRQKPYVGTCKGECHYAGKDSVSQVQVPLKKTMLIKWLYTGGKLHRYQRRRLRLQFAGADQGGHEGWLEAH